MHQFNEIIMTALADHFATGEHTRGGVPCSHARLRIDVPPVCHLGLNGQFAQMTCLETIP